MLPALLCLTVAAAPAPSGGETARNLALEARAAASESYGDLDPAKAIDGRSATRWSGIPGHNEGVWFQLSWDAPVRIGEVVIHQYDRFVMELDLEVREPGAGTWRTVEHRGRRGARLPKVVAFRFPPLQATGLRIANITNGPSFTEIEVHERPFAGGIAAALASDAGGGFVGIVADASGSAPVEGAEITMSGQGGKGPWEAKSRSGPTGLFSIPMPLGLKGPVVARASLGAGAGGAGPAAGAAVTELAVHASAFQYGLTPPSLTRATVSLNGRWKFSPDPPDRFWEPGFDDARWGEIAVPAHWEMEGFRSLDGIGGYRTRFRPPPGSGRLKLRFDGVYSGADVWIDGVLCATHEGGATPFELDITGAARPGFGESVLAVRVREHTRTSDELDKMSLYADFPLAGIFRKVSLFRVSDVHIGAIAVTARFDPQYRDAMLEARVAVLNESPVPFRGTLGLALGGPVTGAVAADVAAAAPVVARAGPLAVEIGAWERTDVDLSVRVEAPRTWDAEHPRRYALSIDCAAGGATVDSIVQAIGFRQTEVRGSQILINGRPVKFRGTCHHDTHPLLGRAVTPELTRRDLELMKEANLNAVRTSHYPPVPELLDIADELGLYVEDEASFCWVGVSNDLTVTPRIIQLTAELVERDRNHPSVVFWSLCNESEFGFGFERSHEWVRARDPSRPTSAATSAWLEIATLHNPLAIARIDEHENLDKPLIFDESLCIFQGIFNDVGEMWLDPGVRDYYVEPLRAVYERFMGSASTQGSFIWCWADDIFCVPGRGLEYGRGATRCHFLEGAYRMPGRGLAGDAPWGVVDGWRRPKPEFWITKKLHSPVKVEERPLALPAAAGEPIRVEVENQYDFTDLSELAIAWTLGVADRGTAAASIPPRSKGTIEIRPARRPARGETLALEFTDARGLLVDTYRLAVGDEGPGQGDREADDVAPPGFKPCAAGPLALRGEDALAGPSTRVMGKEFELAFDTGSGLLRRGVAHGEPVLLEYPRLHVLPAASPLAPLPDPLSWKLEKLAIAMEGENARVSVAGGYRDFAGTYELTITPAGEVTVASSFRFSGEEMRAREIGLAFSAPIEMSVLSWERKAEWSVYPDDHIGRPRGVAPAFARHANDLPPSWPWSQDTTPLGSNDFRSTKRNVVWAALTYPSGPGVLVASGGAHHVRAQVLPDRIAVHVNEWYGGTNAGWWEWAHNYGTGKVVKKGDTLGSTVRLRLGRPNAR